MRCRLIVFLLTVGLLAPAADGQEFHTYGSEDQIDPASIPRSFSGEDLPLYYRVDAFFNLARQYKNLEKDGKPFPVFYHQMLDRMGIRPGSQEAHDFGAIVDLSHTTRISDEEREELGRQLDAVDSDEARSAVWDRWNGNKAAVCGDLWGKLEVLLGPERIESVLSQVRRGGVSVSTNNPQNLVATHERFQTGRELAKGEQP